MPRILTVLAIEDNEVDAEALHRHLSRIPDVAIQFEHHESPSSAVERLDREFVHAVFLDHFLGDHTSTDVIGPIRATGYIGPLIVTTGQGNEHLAAEVMRAGADDYLVKSDLCVKVLQRSLAHGEGQHLRRRAELELREKNLLLADLLQRQLETSRELQEARERAEEGARVKAEFLASMSHELRTPLNSVIGFTEMMMQDSADAPNEKRSRRLEKVHRNAQSLLKLINEILDLTRVESGKLTLLHAAVDMPALLAECVESIQPTVPADRITLKTQFDESLLERGLWFGDELRLRQVVTNLLVNAVKFTDRGQIELRARVSLDQLIIEVTDTGIGIAEKDLTAIFEAFHQVDASNQRRAGGAGLGLAICRKICASLGGSLGVTSTIGVGSTFTIILPGPLTPRVTDPLALQAIGADP